MSEYLFQLSLPDAEQFIMECVTRALSQHGMLPSAKETSATEPLLQMAQVCQLLSITRPTCNKWMAEGRLPSYRQGRRVYFKRAEVLASLERPKRVAAKARH
ncbi:DNA-binding protein [Hymenobacter persicinus]|uniref:DNA-binding protein n=2 Tax=Hymenobacter persicinus TaxID=2025506 RepID=A0A4Q5LF89_9BACT|nr:DNA-binding protein [Hymenobacter persicinus]